MITVHKFILEPANRQPVKMNRGAKLLHVHFQRGELCLWAQVDTLKPLEDFSIHVYGTGHELRDDDLVYIGTAHHPDMPLVFHVYYNPRG